MNSKNEGRHLSLLEQALIYKLYLEQNEAKSKLRADKLVVLDKALELYRLPDSVSRAAMNFSEFPQTYEEFVLKVVLKDDVAALSRVLYKLGYRERSSFKATQSAVRYLSEFPSSPASALYGGRPFNSKLNLGYTPTLNIRQLIQDINRCIPSTGYKFDLESLLLDVNFVFVTTSDEGTFVNHIYEDSIDYSDPQNNVAQDFEKIISPYIDIEEIEYLYDRIKHASELNELSDEIDFLKRELYDLCEHIRRNVLDYNQDYSWLKQDVFYHEPEIRGSDDIGRVYVPREGEEGFPIDLLGCYLPGRNTILLWVDKISAYGDLKELVFQKVLLHECIHALLDIKRKSSKDYREEETVDNTWVLYAYSKCGQSAVINEVIDFISKQPKEYSDALSMYPWMIERNHQLNIIKDHTRNLLSKK